MGEEEVSPGDHLVLPLSEQGLLAPEKPEKPADTLAPVPDLSPTEDDAPKRGRKQRKFGINYKGVYACRVASGNFWQVWSPSQRSPVATARSDTSGFPLHLSTGAD